MAAPDLRLKIDAMPAGASTAKAGGVPFVSYCQGATTRATERRAALSAAAKVRSGGALDDVVRALIMLQRAGVAFEDLARLLRAMRALPDADAFLTLRSGRIDDFSQVLSELAADAAVFAGALSLPVEPDNAQEERPSHRAFVHASQLTVARWHRQLQGAAAAWQLCNEIAKACRHGSPIILDELVREPPGAGVLSERLIEPPGRWVLLVRTEVDWDSDDRNTQYTPADLHDRTVRQVVAAATDGIALARHIAEAHAFRVQHQADFALPKDVLRRLPAAQRRQLLTDPTGLVA